MTDVRCNLPFNHNYIHTNGKMRLCCTTTQDIPTDDNYILHDAGKHSIDDYWNSKRMKQIRKLIMQGKKVKDCVRCYEQEENGLASLRQPDDIDFYFSQTQPDGTLNLPATTMQIQMGNICNLKCKMCSQMYSHMNGIELRDMGKQDPEWLHWVKEQGANVNNWTNELGMKQEWYKNKNLKYKLFKHISDNINHLQVIGGEPTLIPEFYELFEFCESHNTLDSKEVTIVTNLTNTNNKLSRWLPKLKKWRIGPA